MSTGNQWGAALMGQKVGPYEFTDHLGGGAFGVVMEGTHEVSGGRVAVKLLPGASASAAMEFANEGALLLKFRGSSNVVHIESSGTLDLPLSMGAATVQVSVPYHVLELAQGCLVDLVQQRNSLDWVDRLSLWRGVVRGVHQMHLKQVAHRDLKSENCLLFDLPKNLLDAKVADLGRSRDLTSPPMHQPLDYLAGLGDLRFAAPEFIACQGTDQKSTHLGADLYGLGSLLFELATGQGITAMALGPGPQLVAHSMSLQQRGLHIDLSGMYMDFEPSYQLFERSVPSAIRTQAGQLLRQLCAPEPDRRLPLPKFGGAKANDGLEWLLRKADILTSTVRASEPGGKSARRTRRSA